jgi:uncharacterized protein (TIGR02099 family)
MANRWRYPLEAMKLFSIRWFLWMRVAAISFVIAAAIILTLVRVLVGALEFYHQEIEGRLSSELGAEVQFESLEADWVYFDPILRMQGLSLGPESADRLSVDRFSIRLDGFKSIIGKAPVLRELEVIGLQAVIGPDQLGNWRVSGFPVTTRSPAVDYLKLFEQSGRLVIESSKILVQGSYPFAIEIESDDQGLRLATTESDRVLSGSFRVVSDKASAAGFQEVVSIIARFEGTSGSVLRSNFDAFLTLKPAEIKAGDTLLAMGRHELRAALWVTAQEGAGQIVGSSDWVSYLTQESALVQPDVALRSGIEGNFSQNEGSFSVLLPDAQLKIRDQSIEIGAIGLAGQKDADQGEYLLAGYLDHFEVNEAAVKALSMSEDVFGLAEDQRRLLEQVSPRLRLGHVQWHFAPARVRESFTVLADFGNLELSLAGAVPGLSGLKGLLQFGFGAGYLDFDAMNAQIQFGSLYDFPWSLDAIRGRIAYRSAEDGFALTSGKLVARVDGLVAEGKLHMNLAQDRRLRTWGLVLGAKDFELDAVLPFIPNTVPKTATGWLNENLLAGRSSTTGLFVHGSLDRISPKDEKQYGVQIALENGVIQYDPDWPVASATVGQIDVSNKGIFGEQLVTRLYETAASGVSLAMPFTEAGLLTEVVVQGQVQGPVSDLIRFFQETPLQGQVKGVADSWTGKGRALGSAKVTVPLDGTIRAPDVSAGLWLDQAEIELKDIGLNLTDLRGQFDYETKTGLSAKQIQFAVLGGSSNASISSELFGNGGVTLIALEGVVDMAPVTEWLDLTLLHLTQGATNYQGSLSVPYGGREDQPIFEFASDLRGITIDMPEPIGKVVADARRPLWVAQSFDTTGSELAFELDQSAGGILRLTGDEVQGGIIEIGRYEPKAAAFDAIRITGALPYASLEEWDGFLFQLDALSKGDVAEAFRARLDSVEVRAAEFDLFGYGLDDVVLGLYPDAGSWRMTLLNSEVDGMVRLNDDPDVPLEIVLDNLNLISEGALGDPLVGLTSEDLLPADVLIRSVYWDGEDYGRWQFSVQPNDDVVLVTNLIAQSKGMLIDVKEGLHWYPGGDTPYSKFEGLVKVEDMRACLAAWGYASGLEGENFGFQSTFEWPGSPLHIDLDRIRGSVNLTGGQGRIVQAEASSGALKLLGIFDFAEIAQRFSFDLSRMLSEGHAFNSVSGSFFLEKGLVSIDSPIVVAGAGSQLTLAGEVNLLKETLDNDLIVTLPLNKNLPWYAAYSAVATGPLVGAGVFLAQKVFKKQIDELTSLKYEVSGTFSEPNVQFLSMFDASLRKSSDPAAVTEVPGPDEGAARE